MSLNGCLLFSFIQSFLIFQAEAQSEDVVYEVRERIEVQVASLLNASRQTEITLYRRDELVVLDEVIKGEEVWVRVGVERASIVEPNEQGLDFWISSEHLQQLPIIENFSLRMTYCYRYVKKYLLKHGFVSGYLPGSSAYMASSILPKYGFLKSSRKPVQAQPYDVCVYRGGPKGHGHIEVLDPRGWYYGYGYKSKPISNRIFTGCFYK